MKKHKICIFVLIIIITVILATGFNKPSLSQANVYEIAQVHGIGSKLAIEIHEYIQDNPNYHINDLDDIRWIGEQRLKELKKNFR